MSANQFKLETIGQSHVFLIVEKTELKLLEKAVKITLYTLFFYKNKLYKNSQAKIFPKIKNKLRTITRLKFRSAKFKKFI